MDEETEDQIQNGRKRIERKKMKEQRKEKE
jgi:hypothetical protein